MPPIRAAIVGCGRISDPHPGMLALHAPQGIVCPLWHRRGGCIPLSKFGEDTRLAAFAAGEMVIHNMRVTIVEGCLTGAQACSALSADGWMN